MLLRSVLRISPTSFQWPPPDANAWPDAVLLDTGGDAPPEAVLDLLGREQVEVLLLGAPTSKSLARIASMVVVTEFPEDIQVVATRLEGLERDAGRPAGSTRIDVLVGTAGSSLRARALAAAHPRVRALIADPPRLAASLGVTPMPEVDPLAFPRGEVLLGALLARLMPLGRFAPAGHHRATADGRTPEQFSFALGFRGALCESWEEVRAANEGYVPDPEQRERCRRILEAMEEATARGLGAISLDGRMIDLPFVHMAERMVAIAEAADARAAVVTGLSGAAN